MNIFKFPKHLLPGVKASEKTLSGSSPPNLLPPKFKSILFLYKYGLFSFTEASKLVMSYVAAVCGKGAEVNQVKEQLLQSNPVLEGRTVCVP